MKKMKTSKRHAHRRSVVAAIKLGMLLLWILVCFTALLMGQEGADSHATVGHLSFSGVINPVSAEYIIDGITEAEIENYSAVIIEMDTPGGLVDSMEDIVQKMVNSDIPVIIYVSPKGGGAGSAGAFITIASDIAVMAPDTSIGAATPVSMMPTGQGDFPGEETDEETDKDTESTLMHKATNFYASYMRGLAEGRNRNADLAESMVTEAVTVTAEDALKSNIIDLIAGDIYELMELVSGRTFETTKGEVTLDLTNARLVEFPMGFRREFLYTLTNPNVAYILMMLGLMGLYFELSNPGAIFPGVIGGICLILAFYSFQTLPVNYAGVLLILLSVVLFILEIKVTSYGLLSVGGIISLFLGSMMLFKSTFPEYLRVSMGTILPTVIGVTLFFVLCIWLTVKAYKRKPHTGDLGIVSERGVAKTRIDKDGGKVYVHGEWWNAVSDTPIEEGERVEVIEGKNLLIKVKKVED
ncbi:MAG: nodulation protein NfeD [Deltaproteobacteria bacterium]|nr:nodulation protein NfeD [Candidatus Zymogenaceae bacterium]